MEVLKNVGGFVDGRTPPPTAEEVRYGNIIRSLYALTFEEAKALLKNENKFVRAYAFLVAAKKYPERITAAELEITKDTSSLPLYTRQGIVDVGMTLGQYGSMAYESGMEERAMEGRQPAVEAAVRSFIKGRARHPETYKPESFTAFSWGGADDETAFVIRHNYVLQSRSGKFEAMSDYFILDKTLAVMLIEQNRSDTWHADPPRLGEWLAVFGKD